MSDYKPKKRKRRRKGPTYIATEGRTAIRGTDGKIHYISTVKDKSFPDRESYESRFCKITNCSDCGGTWFKGDTRLPKKYRRGKKRRIHRQAD